MAEAAPSIHPQTSFVIATLARQTARKAVKHQLRAKGLKVAHFAARDLSRLADEYLAQHRTRLLAETWERVRNAPALWGLYEKEMRDRQRMMRKQLGQRTPNNRTVTPDQVSKAQ
jgi:hypothetical protein